MVPVPPVRQERSPGGGHRGARSGTQSDGRVTFVKQGVVRRKRYTWWEA